ncbi:hypothetical protein I7I48_08350 [Histoplasma ohiense]|nr:hypothetical protein I7I48_08350 [Histoplasma ohiense (nom. inval.)]
MWFRIVTLLIIQSRQQERQQQRQQHHGQIHTHMHTPPSMLSGRSRQGWVEEVPLVLVMESHSVTSGRPINPME